MGSHDRYFILIQFDTIAFSIGADDLGMQNEGQAFKFGVYLIFQFIAFVDAQPELVVSRSAATDFDFTNTNEGFLVIVVHLKKSFQPLSCLRRERDLKHVVLQSVIVSIGAHQKASLAVF